MSLLKRLRTTGAPSSNVVRPLLRVRCTTLKQELRELKMLIQNTSISKEVQHWLAPYRALLLQKCELCEARVERAEQLLARERDDLLEEVFSYLDQATLRSRQLSEFLLSPLLRARDDVRLGLKLLSWLHLEHESTRGMPPALADGQPSVYPFLQITPLYFFPFTGQRGLLFLPLLFHEFGHVLAASFDVEIKEHIAELQNQITAHSLPASRRNDRQAQKQAETRRSIRNAYYYWAIEFFCDAVGLSIGGPAYLFAFSEYLDAWKKTSFHLPAEKMAASKHPVTWARVRQLVRQSRALGWSEAADIVETHWEVISKALGVKEDYSGFYDATIEEMITDKIKDMLIVTGPREIEQSEVLAADWKGGDSPVALINAAWRRRHTDTLATFTTWEQDCIERYVSNSVEIGVRVALEP